MKNDLMRLQETVGYVYIVFVVGASVLASLGGYPVISLYQFFLYTGGFILTNYAFSDLREVNKAYRYLTLPASNAEKFFSRWFLTSIVYALGFSLSIYCSYFLGNLLTKSISTPPFWHDFGLLSPAAVGHAILTYLVLHSVAFLGCVYFRKYALLKTSLTVMVVMSCLALLGALIVYYFFSENDLLHWVNLFKSIWSGSRYFFWGLLAPLCLFLAYVRFKTYEI